MTPLPETRPRPGPARGPDDTNHSARCGRAVTVSQPDVLPEAGSSSSSLLRWQTDSICGTVTGRAEPEPELETLVQSFPGALPRSDRQPARAGRTWNSPAHQRRLARSRSSGALRVTDSADSEAARTSSCLGRPRRRPAPIAGGVLGPRGRHIPLPSALPPAARLPARGGRRAA